MVSHWTYWENHHEALSSDPQFRPHIPVDPGLRHIEGAIGRMGKLLC